MEKTTALTKDISIINNSIILTNIETADVTDEGYLVNNGTNRSLYWALQAGYDDNWILVVKTNGNDIPVFADNIHECCQSMQDNDSNDIEDGRDRLLEACKHCPDIDARAWYEDATINAKLF